MSRILAVTGATGKKSGGVFVEELAKNLEYIHNIYPGGIRAIVREKSDTAKLEQLLPEVEIVRGDLLQIEFLKEALKGSDTLVHIAGISCSESLAMAAVHAGVKRMIMVHTTGIYSKYKEAGEGYRKIEQQIYKICAEANITLTILRPTMIYGNVLDNNVIVFIKMVDKLPLMPVVNGAYYELQPVHYEDLGRAYYQVLIHEKETSNRDFILSGGAPIQLREMLEIIGEKLGKSVHFFSVPFPIAYAGAVVLNFVTFGKVDYKEKVQRLCEPRVFSHEEAREAFEYCPRYFENGITAEIKEYVEGR